MNATGNAFRNAFRDASGTLPEAEAEADVRTTTSGLMHNGAARAITDAEIAARIRTTPQADALARIVTDLRPGWNPVLVYRWALTDDRAWSVVVAAGIRGALDPDVHHPNGLAGVSPERGGPSEAARHPSATTYAERMAELARISQEPS